MTTISETRCDRTDLPAYMCSHCKGLPWTPPALDPDLDPFSMPVQTDTPAGREPGMWFTATFPGACSVCGGDIIPGDSIRAVGISIRAAGPDGYECSGCAKDARQ